MEFNAELLNAALQSLKLNYRKMLLVNLSKDTFKPVTIADDEIDAVMALHDYSISRYWDWFCNSGLVHPEDKQLCIDYAKDVHPNTHLVYRRKMGEEWHWVLMEIIAANDYSEDNRSCVLYVRDINNIYMPEYDAIVDKIGSTDSMTGLLNKAAFIRDKEKYKGKTIGLLFADINGLKYINDTDGHAAGDKLIMQMASLLALNFSGYRCYHMSGDEFIVCSYGMSLHDFVRKAIAFHKSLWIGMEVPIASVGYSIGEVNEFDITYEEAEKEMYDDKRIFYQKFPKYKRK